MGMVALVDMLADKEDKPIVGVEVTEVEVISTDRGIFAVVEEDLEVEPDLQEKRTNMVRTVDVLATLMTQDLAMVDIGEGEYVVDLEEGLILDNAV